MFRRTSAGADALWERFAHPGDSPRVIPSLTPPPHCPFGVMGAGRHFTAGFGSFLSFSSSAKYPTWATEAKVREAVDCAGLPVLVHRSGVGQVWAAV